MALCLYFVTITFIANSQTVKIISSSDSLPLPYGPVYASDKVIGLSDEDGKFVFKRKLLDIKFAYLGYKDFWVKEILKDTIIYLKLDDFQLEEVLIPKKKPATITGVINKIFIGETNFSFNQKAFVLFENEKKIIKSISLEIIDVFGVKNIKYRPFRIGIYNFEGGTIGTKIFESEILEKKDNKKFFIYTLNDVVQSNTGYFYVSFEILAPEFYTPHFISSKVGTIAAVPSLKLKNLNEGASFKVSYDDNKQISQIEKIENGGFNIKIEYDKN